MNDEHLERDGGRQMNGRIVEFVTQVEKFDLTAINRPTKAGQDQCQNPHLDYVEALNRIRHGFRGQT